MWSTKSLSPALRSRQAASVPSLSLHPTLRLHRRLRGAFTSSSLFPWLSEPRSPDAYLPRPPLPPHHGLAGCSSAQLASVFPSRPLVPPSAPLPTLHSTVRPEHKVVACGRLAKAQVLRGFAVASVAAGSHAGRGGDDVKSSLSHRSGGHEACPSSRLHLMPPSPGGFSENLGTTQAFQ